MFKLFNLNLTLIKYLNSIGMFKKIKKSKIIDILDTDYEELTCIIFYSSYMNSNTNTNKNIDLFFYKIFINEGSLWILKKKYEKEDIKRLIEFNFSEIKQLYNRNNIKIFCIKVDYNETIIKCNDKEFIYKKKCFFIEKQNNEYKTINSKSLNSHLNDKILTPYFSIKMKYLVKNLLN